MLQRFGEQIASSEQRYRQASEAASQSGLRIVFDYSALCALESTWYTDLRGARVGHVKLDKNHDLTGKHAVVTGGARGIGLEIAAAILSAGASVTITSRDPDRGAKAVSFLRSASEAALVDHAQIDLLDSSSIADFVAATQEQHGRIDILVNNAALLVAKQPEDITLDEWNAVLATNLTGPFLLSQSVYDSFRAVGGGKILNIASKHAVMAMPRTAAYAASKGGLVQLTKALATAWASDNIQVNALLPTCIDTENQRGVLQRHPELRETFLNRTPMGRFGAPAEVAQAALFLVSPASSYITGTALAVDGGYMVLG